MKEFIKEFIGDLKDLLFSLPRMILLLIVAETIVIGPIYFLCWIFGGLK